MTTAVYPGATTKILVSGQSQPVLYGPMLGGLIWNPRTLYDQGIDHVVGTIIEIGEVVLGALSTIDIAATGYERASAQALGALVLGGLGLIQTFENVITHGPPEVLYVTVVPPATMGVHGTTEVIYPGQVWHAPENFDGDVYVAGATAGHCYTAVLFQPQTQYPPTPIIQFVDSPVTKLTTIPSYLYAQYDDDDDLQAAVSSYNDTTQVYVDWFNNIALPIYTGLYGALLDWVGAGLYGMPRPTLFSNIPEAEGPLGTFILAPDFCLSGLEIENNIINVAVTSDDVYKRILTWHFWKGDGKNLTTTWLRQRVTRFMYGANGLNFVGEFPTLSILWTRANQLTITIISEWSVETYTDILGCAYLSDTILTAFGGYGVPQVVPAMAQTFKEGVDTDALESPAQYDTTVRIGPLGMVGKLYPSYSRSQL